LRENKEACQRFERSSVDPMNWIHHRLCASRYWHQFMVTDALPWALKGVPLVHDLVEIGPGTGAATELLGARAHRLTCVEIDPALASALARRLSSPRVRIVCADAADMPLRDASCDVAVALTMLHHVRSPERQDQLLAEVARVLRPGGVFAGFDILPTPALRVLHWFDTLVPIDPSTFCRRAETAGFTCATVDTRRNRFAFRASLPT
jgi:SAM-dependent methyltransferase